MTRLFWLTIGLLFSHALILSAEQAKKPNVILIMTDDQGYGDLGCHGNTIIQTPNLDKLHGQSVRLTQFHVDPTCSPTRSALMTGRYSSRTGVWHTIMGRSILWRDEVTLGEVFTKGGYRTGIFGKWHLGDNYPARPQDHGFQKVLIHGGGGVGQTPDYWGNDYFDDTYFHNTKPQKVEGYCTDVFFDNALKFIKDNRDKPFFCYVPTNAPHGPYNVDPKYSKPYLDKGVPANRAKFWGMITNIDENMGRLMAKLKEWNLEENTILIFMTDNGTAAGVARRGQKGGFNAGMRGTKGSEYDGGHRVPCFFRWPARWKKSRDIGSLSAHIDMLPTLAELCKLPLPRRRIDGTSLVPLLNGSGTIPDRTLFVHSQRVEHPMKWRKCSVMTDRWRLVNGKELYDITKDPGQKRDLAKAHPKVVADLRSGYEKWYADLAKGFDRYARIVIGGEENPSHITCHDWHGPRVPWHQGMIRSHMKANGFWTLDVAKAGKYRFTLRRQPAQAPAPIEGDKARLLVGTVDVFKAIPPKSNAVTFEVELAKGTAKLQTWFLQGKKPLRGAYFVDVEHVQ